MKLADLTSVYRSKLVAEAYKDWLKAGMDVLDIGCGTGVVANELKKKFNIRVTGCDIDKYLLVNIPFKKMACFDKLPNFATKKFDVSMFNDMLHHTDYDNQPNLLKQAMKISGSCLLFELKPTIMGEIADYGINKLHNPNMDIPYTYRTVVSWEKLFNKLGLKYKKKDVRKPFWYPFSHIAFRVTT